MLQLPPRARETARSAWQARKVGRCSVCASSVAQRVGVLAHLQAQRALPGGRDHGLGVEAPSGCAPPGPAASGPRPPARWRRSRLRRACAAACRGCRAAVRCAGRAAPPSAAPRGAGWTCRPRRPAAVRPGAAWRLETKASRGSSRSQMAASTKPAGRSIGTSFSECTARCGAAVFQRGLQFLHEQALAAHLGQRAVQDLVAAGGHAQQFDGQAEALHERVAHMFGLPQGQAAFAGGDDGGCSHGAA